MRTGNIEHSRMLRSFPAFTSNSYWKLWLFFVFGISGLGVAILLMALAPSTYVDAFSEEPQDLSRGAAKNVAVILGATCVFYMFNAFVPPG